MKWIKASDTNPEGKDRVKLPIKYKGSPDLLIFINGVWFWFEKNIEESRNFPVHEYSWSAIEWLDESPSLPSSSVTGEGEAIGFAEWTHRDDCPFIYNKHDGVWYQYADMFEMTTADLFNYYKKSNPNSEAIEVVDGYTQLMVDRRSLPKDGQRIKFMTENENWYEGYFVGGDDIFHVSDSQFFFKWHVQQWKAI